MTDRDAQVCQRIVRSHARTFHLASAFLTARKRRAAFALYAFCRVADDIVDRADRSQSGGGEAPGQLAAALADHERKLRNALAGKASDPVFRELVRVMHEFGVPVSALQELLDGVAMDLRPVRYQTWAELAAYCGGVASSVGEMCTWVFGVQGDAEVRSVALRHARTLGMAMQLTNILRDVGEDARRGRCYLPAEDLASCGLTADEILNGTLVATDPRWQRFMAQQIARARALYDAAEPGIRLLSPDAQRCTWACAVGYSGILGALERIGCDSLTRRARLGTLSRLKVLWSVWRTPRAVLSRRPHMPTSGPQIEWAADATEADELVRLA